MIVSEGRQPSGGKVRRVLYSKGAAADLKRHRNRSDLIVAKIEAYARDPASQANNVRSLKGSNRLRLRVGDFRVIFENADDIVVLAIGPRADIYD